MSLASWLLWGHLLATVVLVGYYVLLAAVVIPAVTRAAGDRRAVVLPVGQLLAAIERRALPLLLASVGVFLATGIGLQTSDPQYQGLGQVRGAWAGLLLVKHLVVVGMLAVGSVLDGFLVRAGREDSPSAPGASLVWTVRVQAGLGVLVLLITAAAQGA